MLKELLFLTAIFGLSQSSAVNSTRLGQLTTYHHYTKSRPHTPVAVVDENDILNHFIPDAPLVVIVHGHLGDAFTAIDLHLMYEILKLPDLYNVVIVDWSAVARSGYEFASGAVPSIGRHLFEFLQRAHLSGYRFDSTRLIGYDLGAHVCGFAGRESGGQISYITGLSPHRNGWTEARGALRSGDAAVVEIIHTSNVYGIDTPMGDIDIFINGGRVQPGCGNHQCHHRRAVEIMAASIRHTLQGNLCNTLAEARANTCRSFQTRVGSLQFKIARGIYRANTGNTFPFCLQTCVAYP